ncbi:hypothetical protein [Eubacterium maltosivorans]|uniref:hypothetical protein n=1 Tax=Eubacterium maltosivorans TaxID=2041044 RepID=UPI001587FDDC|nr:MULTISPECIES: hypothetical protein [Eubacterium]MDO5430997.1 hypothetical protein [Eubacterium sp.]
MNGVQNAAAIGVGSVLCQYLDGGYAREQTPVLFIQNRVRPPFEDECNKNGPQTSARYSVPRFVSTAVIATFSIFIPSTAVFKLILTPFCTMFSP